MGTSNYPNGFRWGVTIRNVPILNTHAKNVYYVDSVNGSNANDGTFNFPRASVDYLFANDIVQSGDVVICKPGHIETIATTSTWDIAGVTIVMQGEGSSRAYFNFTATDAYVDITGAGITLIRPKLVVGIDQVAKGILVEAADVTLVDVEDYDAANKNALIMVLTTAAALRLRIYGYRYFEASGGTQKTDRIKTVGAISDLVLHDINIMGDFSASPVDVSAAGTNLDLNRLNLNNTNTGPESALTLHANCTGFAENVKLRVVSGTDYVSDTAKLQWGTMCQGYNDDGSGGVSIGAAADISTAVDSVGAQAVVIDSVVDSIAAGQSAIGAAADSVGAQATAVASVAADAVASVDSVGVQTSAAQSIVLSRAIRTDSLIGSAGVTASEVTSQATSIGVGVSAALANTISLLTSVASQAASVGIGASACHAQVQSLATSVASQAASVGTGTSNANANALSAVSAAASAAVGASAANANALSACGSVTTVSTGVSAAHADVLSTAASVASVGASAAVGASQAHANTCSILTDTAQIESTLASFALIISAINSNTA